MFSLYFVPWLPLAIFGTSKLCSFLIFGIGGRGMLGRFLKRLVNKIFPPQLVQFSSVAQSCLTRCNPMDCSTPGFPVHHQLPEFAHTHVHRVGDAINHLILCCPLLFPPSIFPSIRVFSNESVLHIRWPKYWNSSSASVLPMNIQD